jgi:hypothetical protein
MASDSAFGLNPQEVGERLMLLRRVLGVNQREMAEFLGCGATSMNMYEGGSPVLPVQYAAKLNYIHGIPLDWIYLGKRTMLPYEIGLKLAEMEKKKAEGTLEPEPRIRRRLA